MTNLKFIFLTLFILPWFATFSQTEKTIDSLEVQYQACLDKGQFMLGCSETFYFQMDSLLNVVYKKLRSNCDSIEKENLKDEQLEWLSKREIQFKQNKQKEHKNAKENDYDGGQDETMMLTDDNANFVKERVINLIKSSPENYAPGKYKVNPTGFYSLDNKTENKNGDTYGYFGDIEVKSLSNNKIVLRLFVCKGAPSYNSGTLADTLTIRNNIAIYKDAEFDSSCRITFTFFKLGIKVEEITDDYNSGCGFGHAVIVNGYYKRISNKMPSDKDLSY